VDKRVLPALGKNLNRLRIKADLTQERLAEEADISLRYVQQLLPASTIKTSSPFSSNACAQAIPAGPDPMTIFMSKAELSETSMPFNFSPLSVSATDFGIVASHWLPDNPHLGPIIREGRHQTVSELLIAAAR